MSCPSYNRASPYYILYCIRLYTINQNDYEWLYPGCSACLSGNFEPNSSPPKLANDPMFANPTLDLGYITVAMIR